MENKLTPELIEKAKQAKSEEELIALAKENGIELTAKDAKACFARLKYQSSELSDDELDSVVGGGCTTYKDGHPVITAFNSCKHWVCERCGTGQKIDNWGDLECAICRSGVSCGFCKYSRYESALLLCFCPKRLYN